MPGQAWVAPVPPYFWTVDGAAYANATAVTSISPLPDSVLPANFLNVGSRLRVTAAGRFSTTGTPTLILGLYYGLVTGVALGVSAAITTSSGASNLTWRAEWTVDVRTNGASGTAMTTGMVFGVSGATAVNTIPASAPAVATIDTTVSKALEIGATWGTASASNTITCHSYLVESLA